MSEKAKFWELWKVMAGREAILVENQGIIKTSVVSISEHKVKEGGFTAIEKVWE